MLVSVICYIGVIISLGLLMHCIYMWMYEESIVKVLNARLGVCYSRKYKYKNVIQACDEDLACVVNDSKQRAKIEQKKNDYENRLRYIDGLIEEYEDLMSHMEDK